LLENYLQGVISDTTIQGSQGSTAIDSLKVAIPDLRLTPVEIPALHQNLISSAALVLPTNIAQTGIAYASFTIDNPFTASINILEVTSTVTYQQLTVGKIDHVDLTSSPVHANGHSNITSPQLPFQFNLDPLTIVQLLLSGAQNNHIDLGPLIELLKIVAQNPNYHPPVRRDWNKHTVCGLTSRRSQPALARKRLPASGKASSHLSTRKILTFFVQRKTI